MDLDVLCTENGKYRKQAPDLEIILTVGADIYRH